MVTSVNMQSIVMYASTNVNAALLGMIRPIVDTSLSTMSVLEQCYYSTK
jgi:hypothetical protein